MPKFSAPAPTAVASPLVTTTPAYTHEGHVGWSRDAKSELFLLAVSHLVREDTFYESAEGRDNRFVALLHQVTAEDPDWMRRFLPWLRSDVNMRSAPVVGVAEYVKAGGPHGRALIRDTLLRPDEPAELLGYWLQTHGRKIPAAVKRGIADAAVNLYTERAALRYDGQSRGIRMADVIELTHPKPKAAWQSALFKWLLDRRHHGDESADESLPLLTERARLEATPSEQRRALLGTFPVPSWEWLSGWLPDGMDADAWTAAIPTMGYMALLRNLRNFEQANVPAAVIAAVNARLCDPPQVAKSRQFPMRFLNAHNATGSLTFAASLETALDLSVQNLPQLRGRTLVLVDMSGSMFHSWSRRGSGTLWETVAVFGAALAARNDADLVVYSNDAALVALQPSVLRTVGVMAQWPGAGGGTQTMQTIAAVYGGQDRVVVLTDEQAHPGPHLDHIAAPIYTFNVGGYRTAQFQATGTRLTFGGGLTDQAFRMLALLEAGRDGEWPF